MTFREQLWASLVGSFFGFVFAISLFFITNWIQLWLRNKSLQKHLQRELSYNISWLQELADDIDKILRQIIADDHGIYHYLRYSYFQRYFIQESFRNGILYDKLNNEDISYLNQMLLHCDVGVEQYVNSLIAQWKNQQIDKKAAVDNFEFQKSELVRYKKHLEQLLLKIRRQANK